VSFTGEAAREYRGAESAEAKSKTEVEDEEDREPEYGQTPGD
jgi:hypothetical protein